ncbi:MAG: hypothetical protein A2785_02615 [Candidatus Chisholmbacteria bacterium RIFCSPHIGHO2_01_FULL_49_18]|uniref:Uncharacterized protein n=1 Tax=Candidatus Chisholmbacteria bacterium RIFCSPHIGHO2_01_FULL_49_18 TaxID=1797590 RepID=A0A1G1VKV2_9BACT|nr:MAG: hypothetical protein A2785_02615 [Candidatus Chisholmbacteria bacterium RIFCSPHIGHO2_01_FULL_49_18]
MTQKIHQHRGKQILFFSSYRWARLSKKYRDILWKLSEENRVIFVPPMYIDPLIQPDEDLDEIVFLLSPSIVYFISLFFQKNVIFNLRFIRLFPFRNFFLTRRLNELGYQIQRKLFEAVLKAFLEKDDISLFRHAEIDQVFVRRRFLLSKTRKIP